jgi:hypothetical protein
MAAVASSFALLPVGVARATEELEIAELPPVYVPVLFGVGLLVGVGFFDFKFRQCNGRGVVTRHAVGCKSKERSRTKSIFLFQKVIRNSFKSYSILLTPRY